MLQNIEDGSSDKIASATTINDAATSDILHGGFYSQYYYSGSTADDTAIRTTVMQDFTADKSSNKAM